MSGGSCCCSALGEHAPCSYCESLRACVKCGEGYEAQDLEPSGLCERCAMQDDERQRDAERYHQEEMRAAYGDPG